MGRAPPAAVASRDFVLARVALPPCRQRGLPRGPRPSLAPLKCFLHGDQTIDCFCLSIATKKRPGADESPRRTIKKKLDDVLRKQTQNKTNEDREVQGSVMQSSRSSVV